MDLQLSDKVALVSGSTAGIGLAIATTLAEEGATVIVNGRTQERVNHALEILLQSVPNAKLQGIAADLGTKAGVRALQSSYAALSSRLSELHRHVDRERSARSCAGMGASKAMPQWPS